jgi:hypothetical protein
MLAHVPTDKEKAPACRGFEGVSMPQHQASNNQELQGQITQLHYLPRRLKWFTTIMTATTPHTINITCQGFISYHPSSGNIDQR